MKQNLITIIGGNGYIGRSIAKHAINRGFNVNCISRSGQVKDGSGQSHWDKKINHIKGDALKPQEFKDILIQSDKIIHSVGILRAQSDEQYVQLNRDSAVSIAKYVDELSLQDNLTRKFLMISSSHYPPFMKRYLETKEEAEKIIKNETKLNYVILKPGFIYSAKERWWSSPLKGPVDLAFNIFGGRQCNNNIVKFESSISLNEVCLATLYALENEEISKTSLFNNDISKYAQLYKEKHNIIFTV
ncbi:hypothetical protein ABPG74_004084 [Tetrahymena malaccensis]